MPSYRCKMLGENGDILFPADIVAESLAAAIQHASKIRRMSNEGSNSMLVQLKQPRGCSDQPTAQPR